jgi:hypothetical protein
LLKKAVTHPLARRLTLREYLPLSAWLLTWFLLGLAVGHADAVRLFAANTFVQSVRGLVALEMVGTLSRRVGQGEALRASIKRALGIDLLVLLAAGAVAALLAGFLWWRDMATAAGMVLIIALAYPARHPGGVLVVSRERETPWRLGAALAGVAGAALVWWLGGEWWQAALVLAARDWGGLLLTALTARRRAVHEEPETEPMRFAELAARTEAAARRRLIYRMAKSLLSGLLGPFGSVIARTGRGARLDAKLSRMVPRHRGGMALLALASGGVMLFFLVVAREPATLVLAAVSARIAASAGSALLWWNYGTALKLEEDDDDD